MQKPCRRSFSIFRTLFCAVLIPFTIALPAPVFSSENHIFNLYIRGIKAGTISTATNKNGVFYAVSGAIHPTAFLRTLRDVGYEGAVSGSYKGTRYRPRKYQGNTKTGSRNSVVSIRYSNGMPVVESYLPEREKRDYDIEPSAQKGTLDLLTAAYSVFEDSPVSKLCNRSVQMFDGRRRSRLAVGSPEIGNDGITCQGSYTRVAGFSPAALQKRVNFPFTLAYEQQEDGKYRLMSFSTTTTFGPAEALRK